MAAAFGIPNSGQFRGNDGPWSTFEQGIGTPSYAVNVLPASSLNYLIVSDGSLCEGVSTANRANCINYIGGLYFNSTASETFKPLTGPASINAEYYLTFPYEEKLYPLQCTVDCNNTGKGHFSDSASLLALDIVTWPALDGEDISVKRQLMAPFAGVEPLLGYVGLNTLPINPSPSQFASPLQALRDKGRTPSRYWAYTAGSHRQNILGSLTIGGYDRNRSDLLNVPYWNFDNSSYAFGVEITGIDIVAEPEINATTSFRATIDTTVPELWLPNTTCSRFEEAFSLTWNESLYMYLVGKDQRQILRDLNPNATFTLGGSNLHGSDSGQSFTLSYDSFDLEVGWPLGGITSVNDTAYYFALKLTVSESQYTLGRAFFQETYLGVDYDRERFCITPSLRSDKADIVTVACVVALLTAIILGVVLLRKRSIRRRQNVQAAKEGEGDAPDEGVEVDGKEKMEMDGKGHPGELPSFDMRHELEAPHGKHELRSQRSVRSS